MRPPLFEVSRAVPARAEVLGVAVYDDLTSPEGSGAQLERAYLEQRRFGGKPGQALALMADDRSTVVALGVGRRGEVGADELRRAGAALARNAGSASRVATTVASSAADPELAAAVVEGVGLAAYRYSGSPTRPDRAPPLDLVTLVGAQQGVVRRAAAAVLATWRARDWVNRPARDMTPRLFAQEVEQEAAGSGVAVEVLDERRIAEERLGGLLGVASGAAEPPRLLHLTYAPVGLRGPAPAPGSRRPPRARRATATPEARPPWVALVGKGITFDSGGLSLKPPSSMMTMKMDMGGAAAVVSATLAAAELELPVRVSTWVAAAENMPSGSAIHPGDVLVARNGKSIEVLNTDAEGRLVLADALSLAAEEGPDAVVDVATLTGGQRVALGESVAAVFGTDDDLVRQVMDAGRAAGEPAWRMPLFSAYRKQLDSEVADIRNVAGGTSASAVMAALFLQEFAGTRPWAHLDIAGPAWADRDEGWITKGGTGWGARTLLEMLRSWPAAELPG